MKLSISDFAIFGELFTAKCFIIFEFTNMIQPSVWRNFDSWTCNIRSTLVIIIAPKYSLIGVTIFICIFKGLSSAINLSFEPLDTIHFPMIKWHNSSNSIIVYYTYSMRSSIKPLSFYWWWSPVNRCCALFELNGSIIFYCWNLRQLIASKIWYLRPIR